MISFPNAKINIGLNIVSKRLDGYHNLETIFYPVPITDALEIVKSTETQITTSGITIDGAVQNNLVYKAYQLLQQDFNLPPVKLHLHKVIPFGAGLGGGSADAAFALKMLNDILNIGISVSELEGYASQVGADCPFFIQNRPTFASGIGDKFDTISLDLSAYKLLVVKPNCSVSTPQAYKTIVPAKPEFNLREIESLAVENWKYAVRNDFEKSVFPHFPEIKSLKDKLYELGAVYASMSGSGSAVFGLFKELPKLKEAFPEEYLVFNS